MDYPGYEAGFGYLRNVGIDQHVVARSRLPDLADSIVTRYPTMLAISVDEGTAWIIRGDTGRIVGRSKGIPSQTRYMPRTPGDSTRGATASRRTSGPPPSPLPALRRSPVDAGGMHRTVAAGTQVQSSVDELYRVALGLESAPAWRSVDAGKGWASDHYRGTVCLASYATADGKRAAFVRLPERGATVIVLTNDVRGRARDVGADPRSAADRVTTVEALSFEGPREFRTCNKNQRQGR